MTERHFTDHDVALILRRAAELDRDARSSTARGLSARDLEEIAEDVGIDPGTIRRAIAELDRPGGGKLPSVLGPPLANRHIRALDRELDADTIRRLMRLIDERVPAQGTVGEALGTFRWTSGGRFLSRQISVEPNPDETLVRVEERFSARARAALHLVPAGYGLAFGPVIGLEALGGGPATAIAMAAGLGAVGWAIGRGIWEVVSARSRRRVAELSDVLEAEAGEVPPERS